MSWASRLSLNWNVLLLLQPLFAAEESLINGKWVEAPSTVTSHAEFMEISSRQSNPFFSSPCEKLAESWAPLASDHRVGVEIKFIRSDTVSIALSVVFVSAAIHKMEFWMDTGGVFTVRGMTKHQLNRRSQIWEGFHWALAYVKWTFFYRFSMRRINSEISK